MLDESYLHSLLSQATALLCLNPPEIQDHPRWKHDLRSRLMVEAIRLHEGPSFTKKNVARMYKLASIYIGHLELGKLI